MLSILISLIIFVAVIWVLFWLVDNLAALGPFQQILKVIIVVVAIVLALTKFGPLIGLS